MISEIKNNIYISEGSERYLFELIPHDLEQFDLSELHTHRNSLKNELIKLPSKRIFKIYSIAGNTYLDTPLTESSFSSYNSFKYTNGLFPFLGNSNIYSNPLYKDDYCKINGIYFRFISLSLDDNHEIDFGDLQKFGDYFMALEKVDTKISKRKIDEARKMNHTSLYSALSDIEGIENFRENEEMLRKIITKEEEIFKCDLYFIVSAKTEKELTDTTSSLIEQLDISCYSPKIETVTLNNVMESYIPGVRPKLQKSLLFHSSLLTNCLPVHKDKTMETGITFYSPNSLNKILIDISKGDNFNTVITGPSGNGKTVTAQRIADHDLMSGRAVFIFEPKKDFEKLALLKNAHFLSESFNPMQFNDPFYLRDIILSKVPKSERSELWEGKLLKVIKATEAFNENNFFKALERIEKEGFKDLPYYFEDVEDKITEKKHPLKKFTYVDFSSFTEEALGMLLAYSFEYLNRLKMPYNLIVDECHRVFDHSPRYMTRRVRELRVKDSSLTSITQSYEDLTNSEFGRVVAENSFHKFFFKQSLVEGNGINRFDIQKINGLNKYEIYYKNENYRKVITSYLTKHELELYRSGNKYNEKMLSFIKKNLEYFSFEECLNQWVKNKYA